MSHIENHKRYQLEMRSQFRDSLIDWSYFKGKTVLDVGCNNGFLCRKAKDAGATKVVGIDEGTCIDIARAMNPDIEFWRLDLDSQEFRNFLPNFDITFCCSVLTHLKNPNGLLDLLDLRTKHIMYFESNCGKKHKNQIETVKARTSFRHFRYLGQSEEEKYGVHYLWKCERHMQFRRPDHRYWFDIPITFISPDDIKDGEIVKYDSDDVFYHELKNHINEIGLRQPLIVKKTDSGYEIYEGQHRFMILKELGYKSIPCRII